jgi:hypothetical protein
MIEGAAVTPPRMYFYLFVYAFFYSHTNILWKLVAGKTSCAEMHKVTTIEKIV